MIMKKLAFYMSLIVTGLLMVACSEDFKDWKAQQTYLPEGAITIPGYTASPISAEGIDLNAIEGETVQLINLSGGELPEGYLINSVRAYVVPADMTGAEPVILKALDAEGNFSKAELQEAIVKFFGPRPSARTFKAHIYADAVKDGQGALIDAGEVNLILTPVAPQISENYYLIGGPNDWKGSAVNKMLKFNHSGKDVYEDPIFTVVFPASAGDTWFAFGDDAACEAIANDDWSKLFGTTGESTDAEGTFDFRYNLDGDHSFCVKEGAKFIKVTLNMMDRTYKVEAVNISENYYLVGGPNDWKESAVNKMLKMNHSNLSVVDDPIFSIVFPAAAEGDTWFAFGDDEACEAIANDTWNKLFGTTGASEDLKGSFDYRYNLDGDHSFCVKAGSGKFIKFQINMITFEYEITPLDYQEFIYVPGNGQKYNTGAEGMPEWGWTPELAAALQSPNFDGVYTGYVYLDGGFKFTKERNWNAEYNWNDFTSVPSFINNGEGTDTNLYCDDPGLYFMKVDVAAGKIEATKITNMNLVGDFNGWNPGDDAQKMTWDAANVCFTITGAGVNANGWKFTVNNDWAINLGSNDSTEPSTVINDLVGNGKNIGVVGTTIKLYPCRTTSDKIYCTVE